MAAEHIQVLDRALDIVEFLAVSEKGLGIAELAGMTKLPKSTVHRILNALLERKYVEKDLGACTYSLGQKFVEITSLYLNHIQLKTEAVPIMHEIVTMFNAYSYLAVLENEEVMYLERAEQFNNLRLYNEIGKREPLYCTALGKVLLAMLPKEQCVQIVKRIQFEKMTNNTIVTEDRLLQEIEMVRENGFAVDDGEHTEEIHCLAVPIYDYTGKVMAAMSVSAYSLFSRFSIPFISERMKEYGKRLSERLGYFGK